MSWFDSWVTNNPEVAAKMRESGAEYDKELARLLAKGLPLDQSAEAVHKAKRTLFERYRQILAECDTA